MSKKRVSSYDDTLFASNGSPARTRTADPVVNSHLLCQLSYWGSIEIVLFNKPSKLCQVKFKIIIELPLLGSRKKLSALYPGS